jgi:hypothetical protein
MNATQSEPRMYEPKAPVMQLSRISPEENSYDSYGNPWFLVGRSDFPLVPSKPELNDIVGAKFYGNVNNVLSGSLTETSVSEIDTMCELMIYKLNKYAGIRLNHTQVLASAIADLLSTYPETISAQLVSDLYDVLAEDPSNTSLKSYFFSALNSYRSELDPESEAIEAIEPAKTAHTKIQDALNHMGTVAVHIQNRRDTAIYGTLFRQKLRTAAEGRFTNDSSYAAALELSDVAIQNTINRLTLSINNYLSTLDKVSDESMTDLIEDFMYYLVARNFFSKESEATLAITREYLKVIVSEGKLYTWNKAPDDIEQDLVEVDRIFNEALELEA